MASTPIATAFVAVRANTSSIRGEVNAGLASAAPDAEAHGASIGKKLGVGLGLAVAAAAGVAFKFGGESLDASRDAASQQTRLTDAFARFPKLAGVSQESLRAFNDELAKKTGIDANQTAGAQAALASYGATGAQIKELTPLMQDYSVKTGKDLSSSAAVFGKALLGSGKSLKGIGINFKDTKTEAGNFKELLGGLQDKVGGFATSGLAPAALQTKQFANQVEQLKVKLGDKLAPVMATVVDWGLKTVDWITKNADTLKPLVVGIGIATLAIYGINLAMSLNPAGLIIIGLVALGAGLVLLYQKSETFRNIVNAVWSAVKYAAQAFWENLQTVFHALVGAFQWAWNTANRFADIVRGAFFAAKDAAVTAWNWIRDHVIDPFVHGMSAAKDGIGKALGAVGQFFSDLPGKIGAVFATAGTWLSDAGRNIISGLFDGLKAVWDTVTKWVGGIAQWFIDHKGPVSTDRLLLRPAGEAIMHGLLAGLQAKFNDIKAWIGLSGAEVSSGVGQWAGLVGEALSQLGQPQSATAAVLRRMQRESGGNPSIMNTTDSNYLAGTPSIGLMQTIMPTFRAYAGQYASQGITDPFANIYAGINYAMHRYGAGWISRMDAPGGYDVGGWLPRGMSVAMNNTAQAERVLGPHEQVRLHPDDIAAIGAASARAVFAGNTVSARSMMAGR